VCVTHVERREIEVRRSVVDVGIGAVRVEARVSDASSEREQERPMHDNDDDDDEVSHRLTIRGEGRVGETDEIPEG
jgi:hypothetical protein